MPELSTAICFFQNNKFSERIYIWLEWDPHPPTPPTLAEFKISKIFKNSILNKYGVNIPGWKSLEERTRFHKILHELRGIIILDGITENQFFEDMTVISGFTDWHLKHQGV